MLKIGDTLTLGTQACYTGALISFFLLSYNPRVKHQEWNPFVFCGICSSSSQDKDPGRCCLDGTFVYHELLSRALIPELVTPEASTPLSYLKMPAGIKGSPEWMYIVDLGMAMLRTPRPLTPHSHSSVKTFPCWGSKPSSGQSVGNANQCSPTSTAPPEIKQTCFPNQRSVITLHLFYL